MPLKKITNVGIRHPIIKEYRNKISITGMKSFNFFFMLPTTPDCCKNEQKHRLKPGKVPAN